jgi:hypothetical protein
VSLAVAGCDGGATRIEITGSASRLVLRPADIPEGMARFESGPDPAGRPVGSPAQGPRPRSAWVSRFRQVDPSEVAGPLVVESTAAVFPSEAAARADLGRHRRELSSIPGAEPVSLPRIGHDAVGVAFDQPATPRDVRFFRIAWRYGNTTASLTVQGFDVVPEDALDLARAQHRHLEEAAR